MTNSDNSMMRSLDSEIKGFWNDKLSRVSSVTISERELSADLRAFLSNVGLPKECPLLVNFYTGVGLLDQLNYESEIFYVVGDDYGTKICIRAKTEDVWAIDPNGEIPRRFISTSVRLFLVLLQIYLSRQDELRDASDEDAVILVQQMRGQFNRVDAHALEDPENWWSVILEQTEQGLL